MRARRWCGGSRCRNGLPSLGLENRGMGLSEPCKAQSPLGEGRHLTGCGLWAWRKGCMEPGCLSEEPPASGCSSPASGKTGSTRVGGRGKLGSAASTGMLYFCWSTVTVDGPNRKQAGSEQEVEVPASPSSSSHFPVAPHTGRALQGACEAELGSAKFRAGITRDL